MSIYHLSVKTISRSAGRSATAAAAYRSGEKITNERTGEVFDYKHRKGIEGKPQIFLPDNAPEWARDREKLWNAAEQAETRKNSTVAREFVVALPAELTKEQRQNLVREFAGALVERHGMAVDAAIHKPGKEGDERNHHAHLLCSTRRLTPEGFKDKTRELDQKTSGEVEHWRATWADLANKHLEQAGHSQRVSHLSLEAQGVEQEPTRHLGPTATAIERRGGLTDRGDRNRAAVQIRESQKERNQVEKMHQGIERAKENTQNWVKAQEKAQREKELQRERERWQQQENERKYWAEQARKRDVEREKTRGKSQGFER